MRVLVLLFLICTSGTLPLLSNPPLVQALEYDARPYDTDNDGLDNSEYPDNDNDQSPDSTDNCPLFKNADQLDADGDGKGDACDEDADEDGFSSYFEAAVGSDPLDKNSTPEIVGHENSATDGIDNDRDGKIDGNDEGAIDFDKDGWPNHMDNCPNLKNNPGMDWDNDNIGDECDPDDDNDHVPDEQDLCPRAEGNAPVDDKGCSDSAADADGDGICNPMALSKGPSGCSGKDNCPIASNPDQTDSNNDDIGDACDDDNDGSPNQLDRCPNTEENVKVDPVFGCSPSQEDDRLQDHQ